MSKFTIYSIGNTQYLMKLTESDSQHPVTGLSFKHALTHVFGQNHAKLLQRIQHAYPKSSETAKDQYRQNILSLINTDRDFLYLLGLDEDDYSRLNEHDKETIKELQKECASFLDQQIN